MFINCIPQDLVIMREDGTVINLPACKRDDAVILGTATTNRPVVTLDGVPTVWAPRRVAMNLPAAGGGRRYIVNNTLGGCIQDSRRDVLTPDENTIWDAPGGVFVTGLLRI